MKKRFEFSKVITVLAICIFALYGVWAGIKYYSLCQRAIDANSVMPEATLAVVCVTTIIGALVSYCLYQFGLKNSRNKYGVDSDGQPFREKNLISNEDEYPEQSTFEEDIPDNVGDDDFDIE